MRKTARNSQPTTLPNTLSEARETVKIVARDVATASTAQIQNDTLR